MKKIVIHGMDRKLYIGEVDADPTDRDIVHLHNAWELVIIDQHIGNPQTGEIVAATRKTMLMPVGTNSGKIPVIHVFPGAWYDVAESGMERDFESLIKQAESAAVQKNAARAGLVTAGPGTLTGLKGGLSVADIAGR